MFVTGSPRLSDRRMQDAARRKSLLKVLATMTPAVLGAEVSHVAEAPAALDDDLFHSGPGHGWLAMNERNEPGTNVLYEPRGGTTLEEDDCP